MNTLLVLALGAFLLLLPLGIVWLALSASRDCPFCGGETILLRTALSRLLRRWLVLRWCPRCGWEGFARSQRPKTRTWTIETVREGTDPKRFGTSRGK
jgi:predicted RNA-binding Zn-ribbon protein involved in translation (DUF1610 family)